ncbi:metallophosphoesterase [Marinovum sp.]|uniref:metallophosphoesterase family protein n=1 Tax=Marinovum sp. TaxID=2024839 RepID=UPI002B269DF1|nr:metallophosphoesterase [Marinovum sp.]
MRLALLSDLHFGRASPELVPPLLAALDTAAPDHIVIAGDFVQRARASQYRMARDFVDRLSVPWMAVPGNHDIPLFNLPARLGWPRRAYRRWIAKDTEPLLETPGCLVIGLDTTDRWSRQGGRVDDTQIARVAGLIRDNAAHRIVLIAAHHPFHQGEDIAKKLMRGAPQALEAWAEAGPHVILTGHLHQWLVEPFVSRKNRSATLQVHCGTGLSTRLRGEPNEFALLDMHDRAVEIRRMVAEGAETGFVEAGNWCFEIDAGNWGLSKS